VHRIGASHRCMAPGCWGHSKPITFPGTQQRVLPEINSPSDSSQFGKSALQRCMAPGCVAMERCMAPGCVAMERCMAPGCIAAQVELRPPPTWPSGDTPQPATYPGTQQRVLPEINSPSDSSQFGKSALQRCMAPGCVEGSRLRWNFPLPKPIALPESLHPAPKLPGFRSQWVFESGKATNRT
jgi:hypothetical protein